MLVIPPTSSRQLMPTKPKAGRKGTPSPPPPPKLRDVVITTQFKKDFKREEKGRNQTTLRADLQAVVDQLAGDIPLPRNMADHALGDAWKDHRDCHIKPDLVLI